MHTKIKNQNSWGIVSMQKLIMALVVISRLNMFQMCPILESLGLFNFHDGSQKISKIFMNLQKKISKNAYKKFFKTFYTSHSSTNTLTLNVHECTKYAKYNHGSLLGHLTHQESNYHCFYYVMTVYMGHF